MRSRCSLSITFFIALISWVIVLDIGSVARIIAGYIVVLQTTAFPESRPHADFLRWSNFTLKTMDVEVDKQTPSAMCQIKWHFVWKKPEY